jgi:tetratricopeptide (TPR) repeat protein
MSNVNLDNQALDERLRRIAVGLDDAHGFGDPFLAVVVYASASVREMFEQKAQAQVEKLGWRVERLVIQSLNEADIPLQLRDDPDRQDKVYFISGFHAGDPISYRSLNFRREFFFTYRLKAILWATEGEARAMMTRAPDFWQVPNPIIRLLDEPASEQLLIEPLEPEEFFWPEIEPEMLADAKMAGRGVEWRLDLLANLEVQREKTIYNRTELLYTLGALYWATELFSLAKARLGDAQHLADAMVRVTSASNTSARAGRDLLAAVLCGLGNTTIRQGYFVLAQQYFDDAVRQYDSIAGLLGLAHVNRLLNNLSGARRHYQSLLSRLRESPDPQLEWRAYIGLGQVSFARGDFEAALEMFNRAEKFKLSRLPFIRKARAQVELQRFTEAQKTNDDLKTYEKSKPSKSLRMYVDVLGSSTKQNPAATTVTENAQGGQNA